MDRRSLMLLIAVPILVVAAWYFWYAGNTSSTGNAGVNSGVASATTSLEIEIDGGFAYVATPAQNMLEIAYLKTWKYTGADDADPATPATDVYCDVTQLGTELMVTKGTISTLVPSQPVPATNKFKLQGAVITFPALETAGLSLTAPHPARPGSPFRPADPENDGHWEDLRFVPSRKTEHGGTIAPNWRSMVDGLIRLKGGTIKGKKPSLVKLKKAGFDFKKSGVSQFEQAMTDRTIYTVTVPSGEIELAVANMAGLTKVVITPSGGQVRLKLMGMHASGSVAPMPGDELKDHCTFYQLLQPIPATTAWLRPHYIPPMVQQPDGTFKPDGTSPGFFCPGDWF